MSKMAMQLKRITIKLFNPSLNLVRNRSRISMPPLIWDPFQHHRNFWSPIFNAPRPLDAISPIERYAGYRVQPINFWEDKAHFNNTDDGFHVSLNVEHFAPNEISVKVVDNIIIVEAKHEERPQTAGRYFSQHFKQQYVLSHEFSIKDLVSILSSDGILTLKAPRAPPIEMRPQNMRNLNIERTGSPARNKTQNAQNQNEQNKR